MSLSFSTTPSPRLVAMNLLALREHSAHEISLKLLKKFTDQEQVQQVVEQLVNEGLISDMRFAEAFTRMRVRQGKGALRIRQELKEKGVATSVITLIFDELDVDWYQLAIKVKEKRFGELKVSDIKEMARQMRFLQYRGFDQDQARHAVSSTLQD